MDDVSYDRDVVCCISGTCAGRLVLHPIFVFMGHVGGEETVCLDRFCSPDLEGIIEKSSFVDVVVAKVK